MWRVGIDTGGTFTDLVAVRDGEIRTAKVPSTPPAFDDGVLDALAAAGIPAGDVLLLAHGTTATTNAVITKTGAKTGLITTKGFRDVLELRRHNRGEIYDILWDPPEPLVPRRRRLEVTERIDYAGDVAVPLATDEVVAALDRLREERIEALAICFLHSYANPAHELRVKEIAAERWPGLYVSVSSDLLREPQEFERTSTVVANSYLGPILSTYVGRLEERLAALEFVGALLIMHSGGGLLPARTAVAVPARTVTSGPAAGAMAAEGFAAAGAPAAGAMAAEATAARTGVEQIISLEPRHGRHERRHRRHSRRPGAPRERVRARVRASDPLPVRGPPHDRRGRRFDRVDRRRRSPSGRAAERRSEARAGLLRPRRRRADRHGREPGARPALAGDRARRRAPARP
jgi:N-methylhydantoinase A